MQRLGLLLMAAAVWGLPGRMSAAETPSGAPRPEERRPLCDRVLPAGQESAIEE